MNTQEKHTHTPGPWAVMACPQNKGLHPFHDSRWVATADAEVEFGYDPRSWGLSSGSLICEMRDGPTANARLIAAAPELLAALEALNEAYEAQWGDLDVWLDLMAKANEQAKSAIAKARGEQH